MSVEQVRKHWLLDPEVSYLNHGSFGACPIVVLEEAQEFQRRLERGPVRFVVRELKALFDASRDTVAAFLGTSSSRLVFVPNATTAVNTVLNSFGFQPGDEILLTNHEYPACRNAALHIAEKTAGSVVQASVPYPVMSSADVVEAVEASLTPNTKLVLIDHVVSQTGIVMPLEDVIELCEARGVPVLVDGAHAPGMLPLNLDTLGATYYTGNCHKWMCGPKSSAFLYVKPSHQAGIRPLVISHGAGLGLPLDERFHAEFDWMGTRDPSPVLAMPRVIEFMGTVLPGGWEEVMTHNHALVLEGRQLLGEALGVGVTCPNSMVGSMATIELPDAESPRDASPPFLDPLQDWLFYGKSIEVPIVVSPVEGKRLIRISAQVYNHRDEYVRLASALEEYFS